MKVGLAYDLKKEVVLTREHPDDALEEYDYPETVEAIAAAVASEGHSVVKLGGGRRFLENILREEVDFVFNIAEGRGTYRSREAQVPSVLEMQGIPYSGSDPECLAVCLDKPLTKTVVAAAGVRTPRWRVIADVSEIPAAPGGVGFPLIVKPAYEGSSKGVHRDSLVEGPTQLDPVLARQLELYRQPVMLEEFIPGDEVTVGITGNSPPRVVGLMRILPRQKQARFVYSVEVKRDWRALVDYECPAQLKEQTLAEITEASVESFRVLGCRDFARIDFRLDAHGIPYFLEINPLPGLGDYSDLVIMAVKMGMTQQTLIVSVLRAALERYSPGAHGSHRLQ